MRNQTLQGKQGAGGAPAAAQRTPQDIIAEALREAQEEASAKKVRTSNTACSAPRTVCGPMSDMSTVCNGLSRELCYAVLVFA